VGLPFSRDAGRCPSLLSRSPPVHAAAGPEQRSLEGRDVRAGGYIGAAGAQRDDSRSTPGRASYVARCGACGSWFSRVWRPTATTALRCPRW